MRETCFYETDHFPKVPVEDAYQSTFLPPTSQKHLDIIVVVFGHHSRGGFAHSVKDYPPPGIHGFLSSSGR
jgi:hypothetical protein